MSTNEMIGIIVVALSSLLGLGVIIVKPILKVVETMTILNESIKALTKQFNNFEVNNHDAHKRIWTHNEAQDDTLQSHERRIYDLEKEVGINDN